MPRPVPFLVCVLLLLTGNAGRLLADALPVDAIEKGQPVSFTSDVLPALKKNCVACHNAGKDEAGVNLESFEAIFNSDYGELVAAGEPADSRLFVLASHADEPVMPPEPNNVAAKNLTPTELGFLREWIVRGAKADPKPTTVDSIAWQSLSTAASPTYATSLTGDARLIVASRGNRLHVFGKNSPNAIAELKLPDDQPAHRDLVQDVAISDDGRTIVSAGYRNVKLWTLEDPQLIETADFEDTSELAVSCDGTQLVCLQPDGQILVASTSKPSETWSKPAGLSPDQLQNVTGLAVSNDGSRVAFAVGIDVYVLDKTADSPATSKLPAIVTDIGLDGGGLVVVGDQTGTLTTFSLIDNSWQPASEKLFDTTVEFLELSCDGRSIVVADAVGNVAWRPRDAKAFSIKAKLPTGAQQAAIAHDDSAVWIGLTNRGLVRISKTQPEFEHVYQNDPVLEDERARVQWDTVVEQQLINANEADLKRTEANHSGEKANQEKLNADIEKRKKDVPEAAKVLETAQTALASAKTKLDEATAARDTAKANRSKLEDAISKLSVEIAELTKTPDDTEALEAAKKSKASQEAALKKAPVLKPVEDAVTAAEKVFDAATADVKTKLKSHENAEAALKLAHEAKSRSDAQLAKLSADIERWKQTVERSKAVLETTKKTYSDIETKRNASRPFKDAVVALPAGGFLSRGTSGAWSIWSTSGDWIAEITNVPADGEVVAASAGVVLLKSNSSKLAAVRINSPAWKLQRTLGSIDNGLPFADRVLCLDIDPDEKLLATGGGVPARSGDVHLWNLDDGSLVTAIPGAHTDTVLAVRFSPDGKRLATASADRLIKLWDVSTGENVGVLEGHTHHVTTLDWNVTQRQIASASADFDIRSWDLNTMKTSRKISLFKTEVTNLAYAGQTNRIAAVGGDQTFRVITTDNGRQESTAGLANGYGFAVSANRGGDLFVLGGADGKPRLVDNKGKVLQTFAAE